MNEPAPKPISHITKSNLSRRNFIAITTGGLASITLAPAIITQTKIKAIAFDAFVIFDPRPVFKLVNQLFPAKGNELAETWRTKQFEYTWIRASAGQYADFWKVTEDALLFAAAKTGVALNPADKEKLIAQYLKLEAWPDVIPALKKLREQGIRLTFLSNMTDNMMKVNSQNAQISDYFEAMISTDQAKTYKPAKAAYQLGIDHLKLKKDEILFAAFAGWDACGAKWFGYPTYWVNRQGSPAEEFGIKPDSMGKSMNDLLSYI
jgi:2-haloacid dehalogenase